ncbi:MAG: D-lyxose/D-mannose family sugar isomerase, partial [Chthoniobacterales bacterium]
MKRSQINGIYREAVACFERHGWALPPEPRWDITDFGLDDFDRYGLVLINLAEEPEYCEKLMYARVG